MYGSFLADHSTPEKLRFGDRALKWRAGLRLDERASGEGEDERTSGKPSKSLGRFPLSIFGCRGRRGGALLLSLRWSGKESEGLSVSERARESGRFT